MNSGIIKNPWNMPYLGVQDIGLKEGVKDMKYKKEEKMLGIGYTTQKPGIPLSLSNIQPRN